MHYFKLGMAKAKNKTAMGKLKKLVKGKDSRKKNNKRIPKKGKNLQKVLSKEEKEEKGWERQYQRSKLSKWNLNNTKPSQDPTNNEGVDYSLAIRNMFGYDRRKYFNDEEEESDMESSPQQIAKEEEWSIAEGRREDEAELRKGAIIL